MSFLTPRLSRVVIGLAVATSCAAVPMAAQAADTGLSGTLAAGALTNTAPAIAPLGSVALTGVNQTITTSVGAWNVTDATGSNDGYSVTVAATAPQVDGDTGAAGTGGSLSLTPTTPTAAAGNPAAAGPVASPVQSLSTTASTIANADAGTGQGSWDFAADAGADESLSVVIPGDAAVGAYTSTLTYTTAAAVV